MNIALCKYSHTSRSWWLCSFIWTRLKLSIYFQGIKEKRLCPTLSELHHLSRGKPYIWKFVSLIHVYLRAYHYGQINTFRTRACTRFSCNRVKWLSLFLATLLPYFRPHRFLLGIPTNWTPGRGNIYLCSCVFLSRLEGTWMKRRRINLRILSRLPLYNCDRSDNVSSFRSERLYERL